MEWYEADETWEVFYSGLTREEYVNKYVVEGFFHESVPQGIKDAFKGVSYIMAAAYNHYPLLDDAIVKMLLSFEIVIKMKIKALGLETTHINKKGKEQEKRLVDLIDEIGEQPQLTFLKPDLTRIRNFRNVKMHPKEYGFAGALGHTPENARLFINVINLLFLPDASLKKIHSKIDIIGKQLEEYKTGLFTLAYEDTKILINGIYTFKYRAYQDRELLLLYVDPIVTSVKELYIDKKYPDSLLITLQDFQINEYSISGIDINGQAVVVKTTTKDANIATWTAYNQELKTIGQNDIDSYIAVVSNRALFKMEKIIYEQMWYPVRKAL